MLLHFVASRGTMQFLLQHSNDMKRNYSWGTVNELITLGILAGISVSYINAADRDPTKWIITDVYNTNTLGIPSDPI